MCNWIIKFCIFIMLAIMQKCVCKSNDNDHRVNSITSDPKSTYRQQYAQQMLSYMNRSVPPCDDFYEYACGNWKNVIEKRYTSTKRHSVFDLKFKFDDFIENMLQKTNIDDIAPDYTDEFKLSQQYYKNCIKSDLYPMKKSPEYLNILNEIGAFPAVNSSWNSENFSWINMSAHMTNYGVVGLIKEDTINKYPFSPFFITPDIGIGIQIDYNNTIDLNNSFDYEINRKNMHNILSLYNVEETRIADIINEIFVFFKAVIKVIKVFNKDYSECHSLTDEFTDSEIEEVVKLWQSYYEISWSNKDFSSKYTPCIYFYRHLIDICNKHKEAVANYLSLRFLYHVDAHLTDKTLQKDYCLQEIKMSMKYLFDHLYFKLNYNNSTIEEVTSISQKLRQSLRELIQKIDWIDDSMRNKSLKRESSIKEYIGQSNSKYFTDRRIKEIKKLKFLNESFAANNLNLKKFRQYMERHLCIHKEDFRNETLKNTMPMEVYAYYDIYENIMFIYYGALQPPVFHKDLPNSLKFGTLGQIIAHELSHGFEEHKWLPPERSNCFVDQFNKYHIPEVNRYINGQVTRDENIADSNGLVLAMKAYRQNIKESSKDNTGPLSKIYKEEQLPGLDLTPEQLFYLGYAQLLCASLNKEDYWTDMLGTHATDRYRVLGTLSHNEDFSKAFNCKLGSNMNSIGDKCKIW